MEKTELAARIHEILEGLYPSIRPLLAFRNPFELLIAVILSAQTTDAQVNSVTPGLFSRFPGPAELAAAETAEVERLILRTGFFHVKARHIKAAASVLLERFGGRVPDTMEELLLLPGVGRKSANVVLHAVFGKPAVIVDTHFGRVVRRLGLTEAEDPGRVEAELAALLPEERRSSFSMRVNLHGRALCTARNPSCSVCPLAPLCFFSLHKA